MTNKTQQSKAILPLIIVFVFVTVLMIAAKKQLQLCQIVIVVGNTVLFGASLASLLLYQRAMAHPTTMGFLRNTYSGLFLKLFVCAAAVVVYIMLDREHVNKQAIFSCVFLYFIYTLLETRSLMQWNKARKNA
jgi:hypothetical protein